MDDSEYFDPVLYNMGFHNNVCHVCKQTEHLLRCSNCKSMIYCSKEHQKMDWKFHKEFCKAMSDVIKVDKIHVKTYDDLIQLRNLRCCLLRRELKRELEEFETIMLMSSRYCEKCLSEDVKLDCPKCKNVFYCSEEHMNSSKKEHDKNCNELKLCMEVTMSFFHSGHGNNDFIVSEIPTSVQNLPHSILDLLELYDKNSVNCGDNIIQKLSKIKCISPSTSILYGLEKCDKLNKRVFQKNNLTIHIVGGELYEMGLLWKEMCELTFHWITNLTNLEFIVIGPELNHNGTTDKFTKQLCINCKNRNVTAHYTFHSQLYHNIVDNLTKPDVVICFNSGLHLNSMASKEVKVPEHEWEDSIASLAKNRVPLILTAYTLNEINADIEEVIKFTKNIKVLVDPHKNPFCDKKPIRDFSSQVQPVYYVNGYIAALGLTE